MTEVLSSALAPIIPVVSITGTGSASAFANAVALIDPGALLGGGRVVGLTASGDGSVGLTGAGLLSYRPARDFVGAEQVAIQIEDEAGGRSTVSLQLSVKPDKVAGGWASGEHYVLARDAAGWHVTEAGENHRMVYVSPNGSAKADGLTPGTAITPAALDALMTELYVNGSVRQGTVPASWHVLFERGHDYGDYRLTVVSGEDELHPFVLGAYGTGTRPVFGVDLQIWRDTDNVVVRDLAFAPTAAAAAAAAAKGTEYELHGIDVLTSAASNIIFENLKISPLNVGARLQGASENLTLYRSIIADAHREDPAGDAANWKSSSENKIQGLYVNYVNGLLIEQTLFHHNGWEKGYRVDETGPYQPPTKFSHNLYINNAASNITFRDNISGEAASVGAQLRPGAFIDGNLFFRNNVAFNSGSAPRTDTGWAGEKILVLDTVIAQPSNKNAADIGARGWGAVLTAQGLVADLIAVDDGDTRLGSGPTGVTNPVSIRADHGVSLAAEDITIFNWGSWANVLPETTRSASTLLGVKLGDFASDELGVGMTLGDLVLFWRRQDRTGRDQGPTVGEVIDYFREGFGYDSNDAVAAGRAVVFEPDLRGDGFRWDNRLNWSGDLAPVSGDAVKLDGHAVTFAPDTLRVAALDMGEGGSLRVTQGLLEVTGAAALTAGQLGGQVTVDAAGQFIFGGYADSDRMRLEVDGGRAANTGVASGRLQAKVTDGQLLLASAGGAFRLTAGASLTVIGDEGQVGFDAPAGRTRFELAGGELAFVFDATGVSTIGEFRSGRYGVVEPGAITEGALTAGRIVVDFGDLAAARATGSVKLLDLDVLTGSLDGIEVLLRDLPVDVTASLRIDRATGDLVLDFGAGGGSDAIVDSVSPAPETDGGSVVVEPEPAPTPALLLANGDVFIFNGLGGGGALALDVDGGKAANTGFAWGALDLDISDGALVLAAGSATMRLVEGSSVTIRGDAAQVGFDLGGGREVLQLSGGALNFVFDSDGVSAIREFDADWVGVASTADSQSIMRFNAGALTVDLSQIDPDAARGRHVLIDADVMPTEFGAIAASIVGIPDGVRARFGFDAANTLLYLDIA